MTLELSIVIPVYNEKESLSTLMDKIVTTMQAMPLSWEVVFVDDGSTDGSTDMLLALQQTYPSIIVAIHRRNFGKSSALMTGFALAAGQYIVTMDSDLQDEPGEIPRLIEKIDAGYDLVSGWKQDRQDPLSKRIPSKIANLITSRVIGLQLHDMNSGLKAYQKQCTQRLRLYGDLHRYIPVMAYLDGYRIAEIPVVHHQRQFGQSKYGAGRLLRGGFDFLTVIFLGRFGHRPLHFFGLIGLILLVLGLLINASLTLEWFQGIRPIGDRPLLLLGILLMLVGIQLLTIGLIAELVVSINQKQQDALVNVQKIYPSSPEPVRQDSSSDYKSEVE
jgi:glycosyltransferase involved in cell wall biosynthesis